LTDSISTDSFFAAEEETDETVLALKALKTGQSLRHYQVMDELGHGGMGEVYSAKDRKLGRKVAIKVLPPRITQDVSARLRLVREARAASALNHPNIITIHSIDEERDVLFIVMEYVEGTSLSQMFKNGPIDFGLLLDIGIQTADALSAAHAAGLVHRDIKPGNIMVTARGQIKLLDFGLAKWMPNFNAENPEDPTDRGVVGTISYMSPEQAKGEELDFLSDIFSLGSVLYEAAVGKTPFDGHTLLAVMQQIISAPAPLPSSILPSVPFAFDAILQRAMQKRKEERYPSAGQFAADLRHLKAAMTHDVSDPVVQAALNRLLIENSPYRLTPTRLKNASNDQISGKIFLVEDNEDNRDMLSRRLQRKGYLVSTAVSGEEAMEKIPAEMPDLILMDISLPSRDGFDVSRELKSLEKTKAIPIIALTAHAMPEDKEKALTSGCEDYDTKPVDFERLLKKVQALLQKN
jgi:Serine/threonine protein kinase